MDFPRITIPRLVICSALAVGVVLAGHIMTEPLYESPSVACTVEARNVVTCAPGINGGVDGESLIFMAAENTSPVAYAVSAVNPSGDFIINGISIDSSCFGYSNYVIADVGEGNNVTVRVNGEEVGQDATGRVQCDSAPPQFPPLGRFG